MNQVKQIVDEIFGEIVTYRRELHKIPEIGFSEYKTADYICRQLDEMGIPYKRGIAKTGIVGFLKGNPGKKTLLMRADMDALPVTEENNCEFRSQHEGMMHACGHDAHMAILLCCAKVLSRLKDRLSCNIKFCFQPAEEAIGGALPMIEEGILENPHVDAAVGGHVMNDVPVGKVLVKAGEMMAAPDDFTLVVHGRGGHGAYPHECIDPIAIMTQILQGFNTLSARYTTPLEKHLISVNYFQAGTSYNVIPDDATVMGTVRV
ncbi:MAG: amidohydrolase, partial [Clostridia bacterium]|nr:amidohydrolase [Clostridia bacterium]